MNTNELKNEVLDFFTVYFDPYTKSKCKTPQDALYHIREHLESNNMSRGRMQQFQRILGVIQQWQLSLAK